MTCTVCGAKTTEGKPFCSSCGRPLVGFSVGRVAAQSPAPDFSPATSFPATPQTPSTKDYAGLWLRVLNRPITAAERADCVAFLAEVQKLGSAADTVTSEFRAWSELCHALLASNEFLVRL